MAIFSLENLSEKAYWVGAKDFAGTNTTFVWIATNEVIPINSTLWIQQITPQFYDLDCAVLVKDAGLIIFTCESETGFLCEKPTV